MSDDVGSAGESRLPLSVRKKNLIDFLRANGATRRKAIMAATRIPAGSLTAILGGKEFVRDEQGRWDLSGCSQSADGETVELTKLKPGVTLRDWFAGKALAGLCHRANSISDTSGFYATIAYQFADAMIAARTKGK